jgi:V/A-type H+-transporting ATPase subunit G/H
MDDRLKRLLEAEAQAQSLIDAASAERERMLDETLACARADEVRFAAGIGALREPYLKYAQSRADEAVAELTRKYEERQRNLREMAARHEQEAVDAALNLLLDPTS